jgi:hypothetical protein
LSDPLNMSKVTIQGIRWDLDVAQSHEASIQFTRYTPRLLV